MSLINKMLQELEGRHVEGHAVGSLHGQVRAAPDPKRIHVGWWIALILAFVLTGVGSWIWGYRTSPEVISAHAPQLALKLAPAIELPPALPTAPVANEKTHQLSATGTITDSAAKPADSERNQDVARDNAGQEGAVAAVPAQTPAPSVASHAQAVPRVTLTKAITPVRMAHDKPGVALKSTGDSSDDLAHKQEIALEPPIPPGVAKQIKELTPQQRAEEEFRRAAVLLDQGKTGEARSALEKALQIDPQHGAARQTLAGLLLQGGRQDEAIRTLQAGLQSDKNHPAVAMMLARLQVDRGELRSAVETLQRTLPYATGRADYQAFFAALLQRDGRHKDAIEYYLAALRQVPQNGLWWMGIGISLQADNRSAEARDAFGRAKASNNLTPELSAFVEQKLSQLR